ncbi:uncharacterized protein [Macrobrachium rosenbergii]|uniref:uncharacterized protein n=1 Tax=Macrobrachium rosenbergii TaxID=79674 RepID=UPI0034D4AE79
MVRCMIRSHNQQYKIAPRGDDAENMCSTTLEPDPRYQGCCSNIFRPGKVLRDIIIGFLVVLAIAVVIAVLFVVCFYVLPETESADKLEESAFVGKPIEDEVNINEVELTDNTRYDVRPEVVLESIRKDKELNDPNHDAAEHHEEHHHKESAATVESGLEEAAPEPEPEGIDHEHMHKDDKMVHEHMPVDGDGKMHQEDMIGKSEMPHTESEVIGVHMEGKNEMPHEHMHEHSAAEGKMHDGHSFNLSEISHEPEMPHDHEVKESIMPHEHEVSVSEMPHEHMDKGDALPHDHMHTDPHDHMHVVPHDDMHTGPHDDMHTGPHEHLHTGPHDHMHTGPHDDMHTGSHDDVHTGSHLHHEDANKAVEMTGEHTESEQTHEHTVGHEHEGSAFAPSAPVNEEVLEVVGAPALETTPEMPTERTVISVSSPSGPGAKVQVQSSESEFTASSDSPVSFEGRFESGILPPLFETLGPRFNATGSFSGTDGFLNRGTEGPTGTQPEKEPEEVIVPGFGIEEVESPILNPEEVLPTKPIATVPGTCRKRQIEMCSDLPYGLTALPNWANDQTERDLNESSLPFFRDVIVRSGCSPRARQYACGILEPPCKSDGSIVPPCRTFCRSVAATCQEFVISAVSLSSVFDCEKFPDSTNPAVCFDMTQEPCIGLEHRCGDGRCVARRLVCDGLADCVDRSDEATCPNRAQAPGDEALLEGPSPAPSIPTDQEQPSSPVLELSPKESPVPDLLPEESPVPDLLPEESPVPDLLPEESPVPDLLAKESPVPDLPTPLVEGNQTEPVVVDEIFPTDAEEVVATTQEYPTENTELAGQEPTIRSPLTAEEEVGVHNEEPSLTAEVGVHNEEPSQTAEVGVHNEEPSLTTEVKVQNEEPSLAAEVGVHNEEPSLAAEVGVHNEEPSLTAEKIGVHNEELSPTAEEVGVHIEGPSFLGALFGFETEVAPAEEFVTTETPLSAAAAAEFEGTGKDLVPSGAPAVLCDDENFLCHDGANCVPLSAVCDGFQQCTDGSDESNCTHTGCPSGEFKCATTELCIPNSWLCDGADDCHDNSDEVNCDVDLSSDSERLPSSHIPTTGDQLEGLAPIGQFPFPGGYQPNSLQNNFDLSSENISSDNGAPAYGDNWPEESQEEHYAEGDDYHLGGNEEGVYTNSESINTFAYADPNEQIFAVSDGQENLPPTLKDEEATQHFSEEESYIHQYAGDARSPKEYPVEDSGISSLQNAENTLKESHESNLETLSEDESYVLPSDLHSENDQEVHAESYSQESSFPQSVETLINDGSQNQHEDGLQYISSSEDYSLDDTTSEDYYEDDSQPLSEEQPSESSSDYYDETSTDDLKVNLDYPVDSSVENINKEDSHTEPEEEIPQESRVKDSGFINEYLAVDDPWAEQVNSQHDSVYASDEDLKTSSVSDSHAYSEEPYQENDQLNGNEDTHRENIYPSEDHETFNDQSSQSQHHQQESFNNYPTGQDTPAWEQQSVESEISPDEVKTIQDGPSFYQSESSSHESLPEPLPAEGQQHSGNYYSSDEISTSKESNSYHQSESSLEEVQNLHEQEQIQETRPQELTTEKSMTEISGQDTSIQDKEVGVFADDAINQGVTTSTTTEASADTTVTQTPYRFRGFNRFYNNRRPTRPSFNRHVPEQATSTTEPPSSDTSSTSEVPHTNFRSRFQQWRTSRIPGQPSYESMRTKSLRERFRGNSRTNSNQVPEDSVAESSNHAPYQRTLTRRPSSIRTSRISIPQNHFYQEEFLKESAVVPETETEELFEQTAPLIDPASFPENVVHPDSQDATPDHTLEFSISHPSETHGVPADINDSRLIVDQSAQTYNFEYQTDPRLLEYRQDTSEYDLANNHSPLYLPYSPVQFAKGNLQN